ncbi:MAG TPA: methylated-DNA--[protein]-cysteine S-methyltransferase [Egibacteraceae bacterium]|nr:methylated-DNA--[protein]-cysteine S-methyltransferase [Egibacteraceae bacterium]
MTTLYTTAPSPVGELTLTATDQGLTSIRFPDPERGGAPANGAVAAEWERDDRPFAAVLAQLDAYWSGQPVTFDLQLAPTGTPFQLRVWEALAEIPYGLTRSYGQLAARVGARGAARAVGAANGCNPLPIIVPCHRVIGADGRLTGYGGGLERKRFLLALESGARELAMA